MSIDPILYPHNKDEIEAEWDRDDLEVIFDVVDEDDVPDTAKVKDLYEHIRDKYFYNMEHEMPDRDRLTIKFSGRLTSSGANCNGRNQIKLSTHYYEKNPYDLPMILAHEMIHFLEDGHGTGFKAKLDILQDRGCEVFLYTREKAKSRTEQREEKKKEKQERKEKANYVLTCPDCGDEFYYQRKAKNVKHSMDDSMRWEHGDVTNDWDDGLCIGDMEVTER